MSFFSNIKDRKLPVLEQFCERYAIMAYEVFWGQLACNFKSVKYSYTDIDATTGMFTANFIPFINYSDGLEDPHKATQVVFIIKSEEVDDNGFIERFWVLSQCKIENLENSSADPVPIGFVSHSTEDGVLMVVQTPGNPDLYAIGNGPISHEILGADDLKSSKYRSHRFSDTFTI